MRPYLQRIGEIAMPRDGSSTSPPGGVPPEPMSIGEVADPPFARLPVPASLFAARSRRFAALAEGHELAAYLRFLANLAQAQNDIQSDLPPAALPTPDRLQQSAEHGMPPLALGQIEIAEAADRTFLALVEKLRAAPDVPESARSAIDRIVSAGPEARGEMLRDALLGQIPADAIAEHVLAAAAVQVHMARLAAGLDVDSLKRIADGTCPACGGAPVSSAVVGWEGAHGTRFCTCSVCATQWHVVRIKCLVCGADKGIAYHSLEDGPGTIMGETCEGCTSYVKMLHQHKDGALDPVADDVASLALDLVLAEAGWKRASVNPLLAGY